MCSVIACCFSGNTNSKTRQTLGGEILVTVTSENRHTIHIWKWMIPEDKFCKATFIPGWCFGPEKKLADLEAHGLCYGHKTSSEFQMVLA